MKEKNFKKNFVWNMIGVTLNSFNSMFFMIAITRINGTDQSGIFTLLFSIACLLYNIGIYSGRTFQVTDNTGKYTDAEYILHRMMTVTIMLAVAVIYCCFRQFDPFKFALTMLLTVMKCLEAFSDVLYGVMQKNDELYISGKSFTFKAILSLIALIGIDLVAHNLVLAFVIVDIISFVLTLVYDIPHCKKYILKECSLRKTLTLFPSGFFAFAYFFLNVYLANAPKYSLDGMVSSSDQALFSIVLMPATLINLCAIYMLQPYINRLGLLYSENRIADFKKTMKMIIMAIIGIGVCAEIGATLLGVPVLNAVYGVDLSSYLSSLQIIIVGATLIAIVTVLSTALTTFRNTKGQFVIYAIVSSIIYLTSSWIVGKSGVFGGAYVYVLSTVLQFLLYFLLYGKEMKKWNTTLIKEDI